MKKIFKKNSELKINEVRQELSRAYLIIAVLSIISIVLFKLGSFSADDIDSSLIAVVVIGLGALSMLTLIAAFKWINFKK